MSTALFSYRLVADNRDSVRLSAAYIDELGKKYGEDARKRLIAWQNLLDRLANEPEDVKLYEVNKFFNQARFVNDIDHWGKNDYWATPVELLITNGADCEDYSIAKYYTLKELGVPIKKMSIAYVKSLSLNQAHMVLTYYKTPNSVPVVLDNLIGEIEPAPNRRDLKYVYSFNGDNIWVSRKGPRTKLVGTSDRLKLWVKLQSRIKDQQVNAK
ncbi:sulfate adenylyltransferase [Motiliproteus sp. MSK22-1]|nr:sulfate adenylyltransferase [Motiliproteus sp. MSK22-1]